MTAALAQSACCGRCDATDDVFAMRTTVAELRNRLTTIVLLVDDLATTGERITSAMDRTTEAAALVQGADPGTARAIRAGGYGAHAEGLLSSVRIYAAAIKREALGTRDVAPVTAGRVGL